MAKHTFGRLIGILSGAKPGADDEVPLAETKLTRLEQFAHFWVHVVQSFIRNRCLVRASALSFSTLLALIPMLAVAICVTSSILKSHGEAEIYRAIDKFVSSIVPPAEVGSNAASATTTNLPAALVPGDSTNLAATTENNQIEAGATNSVAGAVSSVPENDDKTRVTAQREAARYIHDFIQNIQGSTLGILGMLLLVYVAISMLATVEAAFNDIWGVTRGRNWLWRIILYWGVLTLGPLALAGASSLASSSHVEAARSLISQTPFITGFLFKILPVVIVWLVFAIIYLTVPNTKVRLSSALVGGMLAGSLWYLNNVLGYLYVSRFVTNNVIYGSLGLLPVFMVGLYFSWAILLFGVQASYAFQNRESYLQDKFAENVNQRGREFIALRLMTCLGLRYQTGQPPATVLQIAGELGISTRLAQQVMQTLLAARLITEVAGAEAAYCPARPLESINAHQVLLAVRSVNKPVIFTREEPVRDEIYGEFARIEEAERTAAASVTMLALVNRARARLEHPAIGHGAVAPTLPAPVITETTPHPVEMAELKVIPPDEKLVEEVKPVATVPEKPARRIVVPEDNHDFPL